MWSKVIVILFFIVNNLLAFDGNVGDSCVPNTDLAEGLCSLVTDCDTAVRQLRIKQSHDYERCGFDGNMTEVVCCPISIQLRIGTTSTERSSSNPRRIADRECQKILDSGIVENDSTIDVHILGGKKATLGEFPHMVALGFDRGNELIFDCGGSVISKNFVLTAAHCVDNLNNIEPSVVRTGVVEIGGSSWNNDTDVSIAEIIKHPDYRRKEKYHDLALLRLSKPLVFSTNLNAACLDTSTEDPTVPLTITGWGQTSNTKDARSTVLLKAVVSTVPSAKCGESYTNWRKLPRGVVDNQLCAGDPKGIMDTCSGDSGGPLQSVISDNVCKVVGITSFGPGGCGSTVPAVYTRVSKYIDWLESVIWPRGR